ncbi:uncharacterized protein LOC109723535 [Ananas comosus]|uniref:Uncharacterized protein LOC109723535 n=1 Tax=Ananas comosus TaxID=4615 RepID=A0A199UKS5_ANACO|nr:uncharacterized protein LOC109723535 [Ananas comosus]XP_020107537.1 uncharacterized protein LOC109723535 [Ananas comosus]OAY65497.1 hypothetical protein ACMD2_03005 [Ananas comosus]
MPAASRDEKAATGDVCVWLIVGLLFLVLLAGGTFLALYISLPAHAAPAWYPLVGISLIGVPWTFWLLMCVYRCVAVRAADVERPPPPIRPAAVAPAGGGGAPVGAVEGGGSPAGSPGGARRVRFGNATVMGAAQENSRENGGRGDPQAESESTEDGSSSLKSHESEVPLALSMS